MYLLLKDSWTNQCLVVSAGDPLGHSAQQFCFFFSFYFRYYSVDVLSLTSSSVAIHRAPRRSVSKRVGVDSKTQVELWTPRRFYSATATSTVTESIGVDQELHRNIKETVAMMAVRRN